MNGIDGSDRRGQLKMDTKTTTLVTLLTQKDLMMTTLGTLAGGNTNWKLVF